MELEYAKTEYKIEKVIVWGPRVYDSIKNSGYIVSH